MLIVVKIVTRNGVVRDVLEMHVHIIVSRSTRIE